MTPAFWSVMGNPGWIPILSRWVQGEFEKVWETSPIPTSNADLRQPIFRHWTRVTGFAINWTHGVEPQQLRTRFSDAGSVPKPGSNWTMPAGRKSY